MTTEPRSQPELVAESARVVHQNYLSDEQEHGSYVPAQHPSHRAWVELDPVHQKQNTDQVRNHLRALEQFGLTNVPVGTADDSILELPDEHRLDLARAEHERWVGVRVRQGYVWGSV